MQQNTTDLPETAKQLVELIGYPAFLELIRVLGGRSVFFSKGKRTDGQAQYDTIKEIVGEEAANTLAAHFNGVPVYVPRCTKALRAERNRQILEQYDTGTRQASARATVAVLAGRFGVTERTIWKVVNGN